MLLVLLGVGLLATGTVGYMLVEGWTPLKALYMTVITITTVGFGEEEPLSTTGKIFTMALILGGVTAGGLAASTVGTALLANVPGWRRRRMEKIAENMSGHVILCGYGRLGEIVRKELELAGCTFIVVDNDPDTVEELLAVKVNCLLGDATDEEILMKARVDRASGVIAALASDADNVFVTMSARQINPKCAIVARAENPHTESKLRLVGASEVVTPYVLGGRRLAQAFLHPGALDLADLAMGVGSGAGKVLIEEIRLPTKLPAGCDTLSGLNLGRRFGLIAVAVKRLGENAMAFNPGAATTVHPGDTLLVMGERDKVTAFLAFLEGSTDDSVLA